MAEEDKKFDAEKYLAKAMEELEETLNVVANKVKAKREEIEAKGLEQTIKDTGDKARAGTKAIMEQSKEDAKKLRASIEEMLKGL